jgi:hypothetical protein
MTPGIYDKQSMVDPDRWINVPHIRDERGDRPVMTLADLVPSLSDLTTKRKDADNGTQDHARR